MQAEGLPDGRSKLLIPPLLGFVPPAYDEFDHLRVSLSEAREGAWRKEGEFFERVGITPEEAEAFRDELKRLDREVREEGRQRPYRLLV